MQIRVTFPKTIPPVDVQYNIMAGMKKMAGKLVNVIHDSSSKSDECDYIIIAEDVSSFYQIGMIASEMLRVESNRLKRYGSTIAN